MEPGQFVQQLLHKFPVRPRLRKPAHILEVSGREALHLGEGRLQIVGQAVGDLRAPPFPALLVEDVAPEMPIELHDLGIDGQRRALLRRVDARLHVSQPLSVARRHDHQCVRRRVTFVGAHLRHHLLHGRLNELRGAVFGAAEFGFEVVAEFHELFDFGHDALLFGQRRNGND